MSKADTAEGSWVWFILGGVLFNRAGCWDGWGYPLRKKRWNMSPAEVQVIKVGHISHFREDSDGKGLWTRRHSCLSQSLKPLVSGRLSLPIFSFPSFFAQSIEEAERYSEDVSYEQTFQENVRWNIKNKEDISMRPTSVQKGGKEGGKAVSTNKEKSSLLKDPICKFLLQVRLLRNIADVSW